jgi:hypothetical protein
MMPRTASSPRLAAPRDDAKDGITDEGVDFARPT